MNGNNIFADSNVLIYILNGTKNVEPYLDSFFIISYISEIEILGHKNLQANVKTKLKAMIDSCFIVEMNNHIKQRTIYLKQKYTIKTPDAIIAASAIEMSLPFLTADKDFKRIKELDLILI